MKTPLLLVLLCLAVPAQASFTPVDGPRECAAPAPDAYTPDAYTCVYEAMEATRSHYFYDHYVEAQLAFVDVVEKMANRGLHPLTECELASNLAIISWWETTWDFSRGGADSEWGLTQVLPCERNRRIECVNGFDPDLRSRPTRKWLRADPTNALVWTASYLQHHGVSYRSIRRYNGSGRKARGYARRHMGALERHASWRAEPRYLTPIPRQVDTPNSPWRVARADEPRGYW